MTTLRSLFAIAALTTLLAACPRKTEATQEPPKPGEATPVVAETAKPAPVKPNEAPVADLPAECTEYRALVDKLDKCDKLGATRDTLKSSAENSWRAWSALPASDRAGVAPACKAAADGLKTAAAAACGW